ncbi:Calcium-transporting ATPase PAT1 [Dictyocoela muelleri]|nr:Calcium-transporting ATPase PAT1 [Dictyocoela muelleri]
MDLLFKITPEDLKEIVKKGDIKATGKLQNIRDLQNYLYRNFETGSISIEYNQMVTDSLHNNILDFSTKERYIEENVNFFGKNVYSGQQKISIFKIFIKNCKDKILFLLFIAAIISLCISVYKRYSLNEYYTWIESLSILIAILIIITAGTVCEYTQERLFQKLNVKKEERSVKVIENSIYDTKNIDEIIVGDIVYMEPGDAVPADCYLLSENPVYCNESMITGEVRGIEKNYNNPFLIGGSYLIEGTATAVVLCVGKNSIKGEIIKNVENIPKTTPLQQKVGRLGEKLTIVAIMVSFFLFISNILKIILSGKKLTFDNILLTLIEAISISAMAVPEGLGISITLALSFGTKRMLKDKNLVRNISSCEVMNNVNYLCTDKTGTLTLNEMTIKNMLMDGQEIKIKTMKYTGRISPDVLSKIKSLPNFRYFLKNVALNSSAFENSDGAFIGSRTESGLLKFLKILKIDYQKIRRESVIIQKRPFNSKDKYMATCIELEDKIIFLFKGAPEIIVEKCKYIYENGEIKDFEKNKVDDFINKCNQKCQRIIAFAFFEVPKSEYDNYIMKKGFSNYKNYNKFPEIEKERLLDLNSFDCIFCCATSFEDPERENISGKIYILKQSGINPVMITGDSLEMAEYLSKKIGILSDGHLCITGEDFNRVSDDEIIKNIHLFRVVARARPEDKQRFVKLLQNKGNEVAFIGDGANDGPAIKTADVGFSMGLTGCDIAKEASDIVLINDDLTSFLKSISWGRCINDSIRKFLQFQLSVTLSIIILSIGTLIFSKNNISMFEPIQLLWINLFMDALSALALSTEKPNHELLKRNPEPKNRPIITPEMIGFVFSSAFIQICIISSLGNYNYKKTFIFNTYFFLQFFNQFNARALSPFDNPLHGIISNATYLITNGFSLFFQYLVIYHLNIVFKTEPLSFTEWIISIAIGFSLVPFFCFIRFYQRYKLNSYADDWKRAFRALSVENEIIKALKAVDITSD